jgi:predicted transcriptional regulator
MGVLRGITIKLPEPTLRRLQRQARQSGRSVAALVRERLELPVARGDASVHAITADLAGTLAGRRKSATNRRRRFRRS